MSSRSWFVLAFWYVDRFPLYRKRCWRSDPCSFSFYSVQEGTRVFLFFMLLVHALIMSTGNMQYQGNVRESKYR